MVKKLAEFLIQDYLTGGDNGLTLKYMRHACGLKAVDPMARNKDEFLGQRISNSQDDDLLDEDAKQIPIFSRDIMLQLLKTNDKLNKSALTLMKYLPPSAPRLSRTVIWEQLILRKLWVVAIGRQKNQEVILPVISTGRNVDVLFPVTSLSDTERDYPEQWNVARFIQRTSENPARKMNAELLIEMLEDITKNVRKTKGKPTGPEAIQLAELGHLIERRRIAEKTLERISDSVESLLEMPSNRRNRIREKKESSQFDLASQGDGTEPLPFIQRMLTYK